MPDPILNPYVGPRSFEEEDSPNFFGRDEEGRQLTSLVVSHRVVLFYAPSGAGKTSLLKAGVIPSLKERKKLQVLPVTRVGGGLLPGVDGSQVKNIYVFNTLVNLAGKEAQPGKLAGLGLPEGLQPYLERRAEGQRLRPQLLILDQFEELFTTHPDRTQERTDFFLQLQQGLEEYPQLSLLFSMREDFIAYLDSYAGQMPDRLRTRFRMELLSYKWALEAVKKPAERAGRPFAPGVAEALVDNLRRLQLGRRRDERAQTATALGSTVEPVHLQIVCQQLWTKLPQERTTILAEDTQKFADVDHALTGFYREKLATVVQETHVSEHRLRAWFDEHLITPDRTRGLVYRGETETEELPNTAVDILYKAYIIRAIPRGNDTWYELAHDRLVEPVLADNEAWRQANLNLLQRQSALWKNQSQPKSLLLRGKALKWAEKWAADHKDELEPQGKEFLFLDSCKEARRRRRLRAVLIGSILWLIFSFSIALNIQSQLSKKNVRRFKSGELAAHAQSIIRANPSDPSLALLLALEAVNTTLSAGEEVTANATRVLAEAVDIAPAERIISMQGHTLPILSAVVSADGRWLVTGSEDKTARLWDLTAANPRASSVVLEGHAGTIFSVAVSADGHWLVTGSEDNTARLWNLTAKDPIAVPIVLRGHNGAISAVAITSDSRWLVTGSEDKTARLWDLTTANPYSVVLGAHTGPIWTVAVSADGRWLVTGSEDKTARLWDLTAASPNASSVALAGHAAPIWTVAFSADGRWLATGSRDKTVRLWNLAAQDPAAKPKILRAHEGTVRAVIFSPDGQRVVTASDDNTARIWEAKTGKQVLILAKHSDRVWSAAFSLDGQRIVTSSSDNTARIWEAKTGNELLVLRGHSGPVRFAAFSSDGSRITTASDDGTIRIFDTSSRQGVLKFSNHRTEVFWGAFSPKGNRVVTAGRDMTARIWNRDTGEEIGRLTGHTDTINCAAFSPNGEHIVTASWDRTARIWDAETGREMVRFIGHERSIWTAAFSSDGRRVVTASSDYTARLWDATTGKELKRLEHKDTVNSAAFSHDGASVVTASGDEVKRIWFAIIWDTNTGQEMRRLEGHKEPIFSVAFSQDGNRIVTASRDCTARIWDASTGKLLRALKGHTNWVRSAAFSPDGQKVITAGEDWTARIWDANSGECLLVLGGHGDRLISAAFSPDGSRVVTAGSDGVARIWPSSLEEMIKLAKALIQRSPPQLSPDEVDRYGLR